MLSLCYVLVSVPKVTLWSGWLLGQLSVVMLSSKKEKDIKKVRREKKNSALSVFREDLWKLPHRPLLTDHRKSHCFI